MQTLKQIISILTLAIVITACNDNGNSSNENNDTTQPFDPNYPLVGTWYEIGSTESKGIKVLFTETNVVAFYYAYNYVYKDSVWNFEEKFYNNVKYLLNNDTLEMYEHCFAYEVYNLKTKIIFYSNDTLFIEFFKPSDMQPAFPYNYFEITLYRSR